MIFLVIPQYLSVLLENLVVQLVLFRIKVCWIEVQAFVFILNSESDHLEIKFIHMILQASYFITKVSFIGAILQFLLNLSNLKLIDPKLKSFIVYGQARLSGFLEI